MTFEIASGFVGLICYYNSFHLFLFTFKTWLLEKFRSLCGLHHPISRGQCCLKLLPNPRLSGAEKQRPQQQLGSLEALSSSTPSWQNPQLTPLPPFPDLKHSPRRKSLTDPAFPAAALFLPSFSQSSWLGHTHFPHFVQLPNPLLSDFHSLPNPKLLLKGSHLHRLFLHLVPPLCPLQNPGPPNHQCRAYPHASMELNTNQV